MKVLIADDHAVVRRGLKDILIDAFSDVQFVEASNGDEVMSKLAGSSVNLLVLDINMPGRSGLDVLHDVKYQYPRLPVLVLSIQPEDQYAMRCLRAGASAYINKDSAPEELALAVKKVLDGKRYVSDELAEKLVSQLDNPTDAPLHEQLSDREHEVLRMIVSGLPLTEIAARLHISVKTVSSYRARITEKMQMKSNAELIRYAIAHHLIE
jgi:two-component system, NarL family, invasion response regulator UvrY